MTSTAKGEIFSTMPALHRGPTQLVSGMGSERRSVASGPTTASSASVTSRMRRAIGPFVDRSAQPGGF